jgi:Flagellar hook-length control protein FliK
MSIQSVSGGINPAIQGASGKFFLPGAGEFADKLTLGQIIKGKVLRQFDGNRYLVNFDGHERVVDSTIPMKTGELLHGRVIGIGERVEMQRVQFNNDSGAGSALPMPAPAQVSPPGTMTATLETMLAGYQVTLRDTDQAVLAQAMRGARDGQAMAMAGILLNRIGLPQSQELLNALYGTLQSRRVSGTEQEPFNVQPLLDAVAGTGVPTAAVVAKISELARQAMDQANTAQSGHENREPTTADNNAQTVSSANQDAGQTRAEPDTGSQQFAKQLGQFLLNVQTEGSVSHRAGTIPLLLGNRLIEVDVAMFEQRRDAEQKHEARHRHLIFRLNTETLGKVEISARLVGAHVRVRITADDEAGTGTLANHADVLRRALNEAGWSIDEIVYETRSGEAHNTVAHAVVEHVISQGSLNHLI